MPNPAESPRLLRFDQFELDLRTAEIYKQGKRIKLQEQPCQVLVLLIERPGELVTREELRKKLWPNDTFVDFYHGVNIAIKKLREALGDSAEQPRFIETLPRRGYRWIARVEAVEAMPVIGQAVVQVSAPPEAGSFAANLIGRKVSHYRVLEVLGGGGMGVVFKGEDIKLGRRVALKFLPEELVNDAAALERFEREARAASALNHPNICTIYEVEEHDGRPFLVMELLDGQTLREHIGAGGGAPLPTDEVLDLATQIAEALDAAHQRGIIHRDIKPANVFITTRGQAKILDFGLAKLVEVGERIEATSPTAGCDGTSVGTETTRSLHLTRTGAALGTACYMSPEQVRGEKLDARTDLFSFGLVLYEMATGRQTFGGETATEVHEAILHRTPAQAGEMNLELPPKLEEVISKALEKDREVRYQTASEMRDDLDRVKSTTHPRLSADEKHAQRWRLALIAAMSLVVLLATGVFIAKRTDRAHSPTFERVTFERGIVHSARFSPDGQMIVYSAVWNGKPSQMFWTRPGSRTSSLLGPPNAGVLAISSKGEVAALLQSHGLGDTRRGTLAIIPLSGGTPREVLGDVQDADFTANGESMAVVHWVADKCRLEFPIGRVLYETTGWISDLRISPRDDRIAFLDHPLEGLPPGSVAIIDLAGNKTTISESWLEVAGLAWSRDEREIWFSGRQSVASGTGVYAVTLSGKQRLILRESETLLFKDLSPSARLLGTHETGGGECRGRFRGESNERDFTWLGSSDCSDISPNGKVVLMSVFEVLKAPAIPEVYIRRAGVSSPIRLGDGYGIALSPDGNWALSLVNEFPQKLVLLPTGLGQPKTLHLGPVDHIEMVEWAARWLPDNRHIVFIGREKGRGLRVYLQDTDGGEPRAITPEAHSIYGSPGLAVSPDNYIATTLGNEEGLFAYPINGGKRRAIAGGLPGEVPIAWSADGRSLFVARPEAIPANVYIINTRTGERRLWKTFMPSDPAGVSGIDLMLAPDGQSYAYHYSRHQSELYVVDGVK